MTGSFHVERTGEVCRVGGRLRRYVAGTRRPIEFGATRATSRTASCSELNGAIVGAPARATGGTSAGLALAGRIRTCNAHGGPVPPLPPAGIALPRHLVRSGSASIESLGVRW